MRIVSTLESGVDIGGEWWIRTTDQRIMIPLLYR